MSQAKPRRSLILLLLGALMTVTPFTIDLYLPAFAEIARDFGTTPATVSLSVTSYFIGFAVGQLIYGPLLDRFGRKKPLYVGLLLYIFTCIGCMQSGSIEAMIAFRFLQALGGCVAGVAAIAMVRDFFPVEESAKVLSLLILILGLSPLLAPTFGGFITVWLGWKSIFIVLAIIVLIILLLVFFFLPVGREPDKSVSLKVGHMSSTFADIFRVRQFSVYTIAGAFSFASLFLYVAGSPVIFMDIFKVSPQVYGGIFALLSVGFIGSNQLNILLLKKFKSEQLFRVALVAQVFINIAFLVAAFNGWLGLTSTIVMLFLSLSSLGLIYPNASALALAPFTRNIGSASALLGFLQIGVAGLASGGVGLFKSGTSVPIVLMMAITSLIALMILIIWGWKSGTLSARPETSPLPH
jgi:MFS transporter, DHA1 family, multidrug resistance protein